jgi:glycosidase
MTFLYPNVNNIMTFVKIMIRNRFNTVYKNDFKKYQMAMTMIATVRGIPQLYYGSEIGMAGDKDKKGDADIRKDFPGGWNGDTNNAFTASGRTEEQKNTLILLQNYLQWRKTKSSYSFRKN